MKKLMFLVCILAPSIAFAASNATSTVLDDVITIIGSAAMVTLVGLIGWVAKWIAAKYKTTVPSAWLDNMSAFVDKAIHYAEEWAKNKIAANETVTSNAKLNTAMEFLLGIVGDDKKLVSLTNDQIKQLIEARLGENRASGTLPAALGAIEMQAYPLDAKLLATNDATGAVTLHLTNGDSVDISDLLSRAGYQRTATVSTEVARNGQSGFVKLPLLLEMFAVALVFIAGCAWLKSDGTQSVKNAVNCTVDSVFATASELAPSLEMNIKATIDPATGKPNWSQFQAAGKQLKSDIAGCALKIAVDELLKLSLGVGTGFAPLQLDRNALLSGYESILQTQFNGKTFVVSAEAK